MKYHEKLRFLNKSYFNKICIVLVLSFTYAAVNEKRKTEKSWTFTTGSGHLI